MKNKEIAKLLRNIAAVYILTGENRFRILAYEKTAESIEQSTIELKDLWNSGKLATISGIGSTIASHLNELFQTGKVKYFEEVLNKIPQSVFPLLDVTGFGPKKSFKLVKELRLNNPATIIDDLLEAAKQGKIAPIAGFGTKSQQEIISALERHKKGYTKIDRMPLPFADEIAQHLISYLSENKHTIQAEKLGSLRRQVATIGDIDLAVSTNNALEVIDWFIKYPHTEKIIETGPTGASLVLNNGKHVDLRVQKPQMFGSMMQYFTGSKNHNIHLRELAMRKGMSLSEYGIKKSQKSKIKSQNYNPKLRIYEYAKEEDFYHAIGLEWIPPELREDRGEVEAAIRQYQSQQQGLPRLVTLSDIRGDLHIHSNYDLEPSHDLGASAIEELLTRAKHLKYEYIGLSEHNPSISNHTENQIIAIMKRRKEYIEHKIESTKSTRVKILIMLEVDIQPDGKLALPEKAFDYVDCVIVSVHSSFNMDKEKMTNRIISGLSHPKAKILAHPTGRIIGQREGYEIDWERLFQYCTNKNKIIEINSHPVRLDLPDTLVRQALDNKVKLVIDTDSHHSDQMSLMKYGISVGRRGWAEKDDIINTLPYNEIYKLLTI